MKNGAFSPLEAITRNAGVVCSAKTVRYVSLAGTPGLSDTSHHIVDSQDWYIMTESCTRDTTAQSEQGWV